MSFIPVAQPDLNGREEEYVVEAIRSTWISSTGSFIDRFERDFAELCGTRSSITVCNGTVALHLALLGLGVRQGDEVLVPSLTYIATANAVRYVGAEPVFVDADPATWCIDPQKIEDAITPRTRGIIAVHLYGHPADMDAINRIAAVHGLWVVEDAAEAHMATYRGRPVGSLAGVATFSFYGNKVFTSGEGGAITVSDPQLELRMRTLRGQGVDPDRRYYFPVIGYNFRLTNVAAAILCAQIERRDEIIASRNRVYALYREQLTGTPGLSFQPCADWAEISPWLFSIVLDGADGADGADSTRRDGLIAFLRERGIDSRPFFVPLHTLPPYREAARERGDDVPVSIRLGATGLNLPTYSDLSAADIARISAAVREYLERPA